MLKIKYKKRMWKKFVAVVWRFVQLMLFENALKKKSEKEELLFVLPGNFSLLFYTTYILYNIIYTTYIYTF